MVGKSGGITVRDRLTDCWCDSFDGTFCRQNLIPAIPLKIIKISCSPYAVIKLNQASKPYKTYSGYQIPTNFDQTNSTTSYYFKSKFTSQTPTPAAHKEVLHLLKSAQTFQNMVKKKEDHTEMQLSHQHLPSISLSSYGFLFQLFSFTV